MPKANRNFANCEDAYFPYNVQNLEIFETTLDKCDVFRCAVSDGATDSIFSGLWAQMLAQGYGSGKWGAEISAESILDDQTAWHEFLAKQELPWYAEEKAEMGAFAATAGLTIYENSNQWQALAIGDCCIFQIREGECISAFPIENSSGFSNFPLLLCSVSERNRDVFDSKKIIPNGTWQSGDQFLLMSDTVACWFLSQIEGGCGKRVVEALNSLRSLDEFISLMVHARTEYDENGIPPMRDDDITVSIVTVADASFPPFKRQLNTAIRSSAASTASNAASAAPPSIGASAALPNVDASLSTGINAALQQSPKGLTEGVGSAQRSSSTKLRPLRISVDHLDGHGEDDDTSDTNYPSDSFIGRRKFAHTPGRGASGKKGAVAVAVALLAGVGAAGFVWFGKLHLGGHPKPAAQPVKVKDEASVTTPSQVQIPEESAGKRNKRRHPHRSSAPGPVTNSPEGNQHKTQMPAAAPEFAKPPNQAPSMAPVRAHVGNKIFERNGPGNSAGNGDSNGVYSGMPPQAPARSTTGGDSIHHLPGMRPSRRTRDLAPDTGSQPHHSDGDTPVNFSQ